MNKIIYILEIMIFLSTTILIVHLCSYNVALAKVTGVCANCHTIHNSQDGENVYSGGAKVGGPGNNLLKEKCIGCHSSEETSARKDLGGCSVPIVYSIGSEPAEITAGGNFWYVQNLGDGYGHNIITPDASLNHAPGANEVGYGPKPRCGFAGCHTSLASIRLGPGPYWVFNPIQGNGCIGCHVPRHHAPDPPLHGIVATEHGCYRFLGKPAWVWDIPPHSASPGVSGIEDNDWEITVSENDHNEYLDNLKPGAPFAPGSENPKGISSFCAGCHLDYHSWDRYGGVGRNRINGIWLRHPSGDTELPLTGEYADYIVYNP